MQVTHIYFDNDLDIQPDNDESFTFNPGDQFVMHWGKPAQPPHPYANELIAMYNIRYIRELSFAIPNTPPILPQEKENAGTWPCEPEPEPEPELDSFELEQRAPKIEADDPPIRLNQICTCHDLPDPYCPVHKKQ